MTAQFIPDVSYADVLFGENAASLKAKGFIENPERYLPEVGLVVLERDSLSLYLRDDAVESISSDAEFWYRDVNLVGADLATATKVLGKADGAPYKVVVDEDQPAQQVYDYEDDGVQLWFAGERVVTVFAMGVAL